MSIGEAVAAVAIASFSLGLLVRHEIQVWGERSAQRADDAERAVWTLRNRS